MHIAHYTIYSYLGVGVISVNHLIIRSCILKVISKCLNCYGLSNYVCKGHSYNTKVWSEIFFGELQPHSPPPLLPMPLLPSPIPPFKALPGNPVMLAWQNLSNANRMQQQFLRAVGGAYGWLSMIMPAWVYSTYSNSPWVDPIGPGPNIIHAALADKNERSQAECHHPLNAHKTHCILPHNQCLVTYCKNYHR